MNTIISILLEYGWFVGLLLLIVFLLFKFISTNYSRWTSEKSVDDQDELELDNEQTLKHHPFFANAQYRMDVEIPNLELISAKPIRERVFKDLIYIAFSTVYNEVNSVLTNDTLNTISCDEWSYIMTQMVNRIGISTENKAKQEGVPEIVIRKFMRWHLETIESLKDYVLLLSNSKLYNTNIAKTNTLLLIMNLLLVTILGDAERVLRELNGEIKGLNYKGLIIE